MPAQNGPALVAVTAAHHGVDGRHSADLQAELRTHAVAEGDHPADRLMTHHLSWPASAGFPGEAMDVASADPGRMDLQQDLPVSRGRVGPFGDH